MKRLTDYGPSTSHNQTRGENKSPQAETNLRGVALARDALAIAQDQALEAIYAQNRALTTETHHEGNAS